MASSLATKPTEKAPAAVSSRSNWIWVAVFGGVFLLACLLIFNDLGKYPLFNPDEALYAEPAREMRETGEYITTWLNYAVRFTKPPLCIWAMALCYQIFGVTEFAARFFGAACGVILLAVTFLFTRFHISTRAGVVTSIVLMTAPMFLGVARESITDMPLALFMTGALMCFYHGYTLSRGASQGHLKRADAYSDGNIDSRMCRQDGGGTKLHSISAKSWKWIAYVLLGLAVMTKGPVGLLLPGCVLAIFHCLRRDVKQALLYYQPWYGALIVAIIAVPWFATEITITKGAYFREFILRENFQRFTSVVDHKAPWWYHIPAMLGGFFPWSVLLPAAVVSAFGSLFRSRNGYETILRNSRSVSSPEDSPHARSTASALGTTSASSALLRATASASGREFGNSTPSADVPLSIVQASPAFWGRVRTATATICERIDSVHPLALFCGILSVFTLAFFSASVSKLFPYTLPAFPALAILVGLFVDRSFTEHRLKGLSISLAVLSLVYGLGWLAIPIVSHKLQDCPPALLGLIGTLLAVQCGGAIASLFLLRRRHATAAISTFLAVTFLSTLIVGGTAFSVVSERWEEPIQSYAQFAAVSKWPILVYKIRKPSVTFYAERKILLPHNEKELGWILSKNANAYIIARSKDEAHLRSLPGNKVLSKKGQYLLLSWKRPASSASTPETQETSESPNQSGDNND